MDPILPVSVHRPTCLASFIEKLYCSHHQVSSIDTVPTVLMSAAEYSLCLLGICLMSIIHCLNYNSFIIDLGNKNNSFFKSILAFLHIHKNVKHVSSTELLMLIRIALNLQIILGETT